MVEGGEAALWSSVEEAWPDESDVSVGAEDEVDMLLSLRLCELCMPKRVGELVADRTSDDEPAALEGPAAAVPLGVCGRLPAAGPNWALNEWP